MLENIPTNEELSTLLGSSKFEIWKEICQSIESKYEMDKLWDKGGKAWDYEYKYRRGGKTLCGLYARKDCLGFLVILGKAEREKFESQHSDFSQEVVEYYDMATTYHDGKWIMFEPKDTSLIDDFMKLLLIKRKPNRK